MATRNVVIDSWRKAAQLYGVVVIWVVVIVLSLFVPWAKTKESGLLAAALLGWLPGLFPGMLVTTFAGLAIGRAVANSLGLHEIGTARPWQPPTGSSASRAVIGNDRGLERTECYLCGKQLQPDEMPSRVCRACRL